MPGAWKLRAGIVLFAVLLAVAFLIPSMPFYNALPDGVKNLLPEKKLRLGLDLQGGIHLVLEVETDVIVVNELKRLALDVKTVVKHTALQSVKSGPGPLQLTASLNDVAAAQNVQRQILKDFSAALQEANLNGTQLVFELKTDYLRRIKDDATDQALETIRNRIDEFGVSEPSIQRQGERRIIVQLPGLTDPDRAIELIGTTALLEFKVVVRDSLVANRLQQLVDDVMSQLQIGDSMTALDLERMNQLLVTDLPEGTMVLFSKRLDKASGKVLRTPYLVKAASPLTGDQLEDARVRFDNLNQSYVAIDFNPTGAKIFGELTTQNQGELMAIVLDNNVYSAPRIQEPILGGSASISGSFSYEEAQDLAIVLRAGSLPAPVNILENRTVGPTLGRDSVRQGSFSMIFGGTLMLIFMLIYYKFSGVVANLALIFNVVFLLAVLSMFQAALTLPGIAGIILTIGMAVDANVIIFERIREELRAGSTARAAIEAGYSKALSAVLDANITTLIAGLVLFTYGTGPIRGFAVTLNVGIMTSLFSAVVITRLVFDWFIHARQIQKVSI